MSVLDDILVSKRNEVTMLHRPEVRDLLRSEALAAPATRDFAGALRTGTGTIAVLAEIKRRSPSKGDLAPDLDPGATAAAYAAGGAAGLSVLTDGPYFGGSVHDLHAARAACTLPVLRKDFVIDEDQVFETRALGADAMLLIVAAVPDDTVLSDLHALAVDLGLAVLVEVHDAAELDRALAVGARVVGVNARDLGTFAEDLGTGERLVATIPTDVLAVAESAIRCRDDAARMGEAGFDAVLVGEMLVKSPDPTSLVRDLASVARRAR
ncbi:MAG TPA: indole-3-glycerol phosphate synthase TrpC [Acidimicrobiia bacterium]|nr:indole-3-glycerol phosphate synthase TrpC [Acidimicrobiia bacterium]